MYKTTLFVILLYYKYNKTEVAQIPNDFHLKYIIIVRYVIDSFKIYKRIVFKLVCDTM